MESPLTTSKWRRRRLHNRTSKRRSQHRIGGRLHALRHCACRHRNVRTREVTRLQTTHARSIYRLVKLTRIHTWRGTFWPGAKSHRAPRPTKRLAARTPMRTRRTRMAPSIKRSTRALSRARLICAVDTHGRTSTSFRRLLQAATRRQSAAGSGRPTASL